MLQKHGIERISAKYTHLHWDQIIIYNAQWTDCLLISKVYTTRSCLLFRSVMIPLRAQITPSLRHPLNLDLSVNYWFSSTDTCAICSMCSKPKLTAKKSFTLHFLQVAIVNKTQWKRWVILRSPWTMCLAKSSSPGRQLSTGPLWQSTSRGPLCCWATVQILGTILWAPVWNPSRRTSTGTSCWRAVVRIYWCQDIYVSNTLDVGDSVFIGVNMVIVFL